MTAKTCNGNGNSKGNDNNTDNDNNDDSNNHYDNNHDNSNNHDNNVRAFVAGGGEQVKAKTNAGACAQDDGDFVGR